MTTSPEPLNRHVMSKEEEVVHSALLARADQMPPYDSLMVCPQTPAHTRHKRFRPDWLVVYRGRAIAVELDDPTHYGRYVADRSRDELLRDCGVETYRIPVEALENPAEVDSHVDRIMARLGAFPP